MMTLIATILSNNGLIALIIQFVWAHLFVVLTQFFSFALILRIVRFFVD